MIWTKEVSIKSLVGADAAQQITETANSLNISELTATGIMSLMQENNQKNSQFLTAGQVFGLGNGRLGKEVRDEVVHINEAEGEGSRHCVKKEKQDARFDFTCKID
jgi:hypothetical protein